MSQRKLLNVNPIQSNLLFLYALKRSENLFGGIFPSLFAPSLSQVLHFKESWHSSFRAFFNVLKTVFTHFKPISTFYSPLKYQKASKFLMFSKNIDRVYIPELGYGFYKCFFLFLLGLKTSGQITIQSNHSFCNLLFESIQHTYINALSAIPTK